MSALEVVLGETPVGLLHLEDGRSTFTFDRDYLDRPGRPVLGQWFEDRLSKRIREFRRPIPEWFENLLPERGGRVRRRVARELGCAEEDDASILEALGHDLPGAVRVVPSTRPSPAGLAAPAPDARVSAALRASLGGFQLKFTLSGTPDRLTLPVSDDRGDRWILKLAPESAFPRLAQNEGSVSKWLSRAGFDIPDVHVVSREQFPDLGSLDQDMQHGFLIRRFDRRDGRRIHQEDLLQVLGRPPTAKYGATHAVGLGTIVSKVLGDAGVHEYLRRTVVTVATGNVDAHLKNWSLLYPDAIHPQFAPLYDQVATIAYPDLGTKLALRIGSAREFAQIDAAALAFLAAKLGVPSPVALTLIDDVLERLTGAFAPEELGMDPPVAARLVDHWRRVPLLSGRSLTPR